MGAKIVGAKIAVVTDGCGPIVSFEVARANEVAGANVHDTTCHPLIEPWNETMIVLADKGFKAKQDNPDNLKICPTGEWHERMIVETVFWLFTVLLKMKNLPIA